MGEEFLGGQRWLGHPGQHIAGSQSAACRAPEPNPPTAHPRPAHPPLPDLASAARSRRLTCAHVLVCRSQSLTLLSLLPVAKAVPLGWGLTLSTHDSCPAASSARHAGGGMSLGQRLAHAPGNGAAGPGQQPREHSQ